MILKPKVNMACTHCGSVDVLCDAYAEWDVATQRWELASTFDKGAYCTNCDGECRIQEIPVGLRDAQSNR